MPWASRAKSILSAGISDSNVLHSLQGSNITHGLKDIATIEKIRSSAVDVLMDFNGERDLSYMARIGLESLVVYYMTSPILLLQATQKAIG